MGSRSAPIGTPPSRHLRSQFQYVDAAVSIGNRYGSSIRSKRRGNVLAQMTSRLYPSVDAERPLVGNHAFKAVSGSVNHVRLRQIRLRGRP